MSYLWGIGYSFGITTYSTEVVKRSIKTGAGEMLKTENASGSGHGAAGALRYCSWDKSWHNHFGKLVDGF